jgi:predicted pore-forming effector associated with SMODS systems
MNHRALRGRRAGHDRCLGGAVALGGALWAAVYKGVMAPWAERHLRVAATLQEMFDADLLGLPWNRVAIGDRIGDDDPSSPVIATPAAVTLFARQVQDTIYHMRRSSRACRPGTSGATTMKTGPTSRSRCMSWKRRAVFPARHSTLFDHV